MTTTSATLGIPYIASQQSQPDVTHNEAVSLLQIILAGGAITIGGNTPPASPLEGDTYVVGPVPTGVWAGRANAIAGFFLSQWLFVPGNDSNGTPIDMGPDQEGLSIWSKTDNGLFVWTDLGASPGVLSWRPEPSSITQLALLDDTNISSPVACDVLQYVDGLWANRASNTVFFSNESQLPAPSGDAITLVGGKIYQLTGSFSMSNRLVMSQGSTLTANNVFSIVLTYTGTGNFISGTNVSFEITRAIVDCPSGTLFNVTDTVGGTKSVTLSDFFVLSCASLGTINDMFALVVNNAAVLSADVGLTLSGIKWRTLSVQRLSISSTEIDLIGIDLGSALFPNLAITELLVSTPDASPSTAVGVKGLPNGGNLPAGSIGKITNSSFLGGVTPLEGITSDDVRWFFDGNSANVDNTMPDALVSLTANATDTPISVMGTAEKVAGTWAVQADSHYTGDTTGKVVYDGERALVTPLDAIATVEPASGTNKTITLYLAINGSVVPETAMQVETSQGSPKVLSTMWQEKLTQTEFIEVFVANETDTIDILVSSAILRLR